MLELRAPIRAIMVRVRDAPHAAQVTRDVRWRTAPVGWPPAQLKLSPRRRLAALRTLGVLWRSAADTPAPAVDHWFDALALADELLVTPALWPVVQRFPGQVPETVVERLRSA